MAKDELNDFLGGLPAIETPTTDLKDGEVDRLFGLKFSSEEYSSGVHAEKDWPESAKGTIAAKAQPTNTEEKREAGTTLPDAEKAVPGASRIATYDDLKRSVPRPEVL